VVEVCGDLRMTGWDAQQTLARVTETEPPRVEITVDCDRASYVLRGDDDVAGLRGHELHFEICSEFVAFCYKIGGSVKDQLCLDFKRPTTVGASRTVLAQIWQIDDPGRLGFAIAKRPSTNLSISNFWRRPVGLPLW
jgi:hypothetical protein